MCSTGTNKRETLGQSKLRSFFPYGWRVRTRPDGQFPFAYECLHIVVARCSSLRMYIHVHGWRYEKDMSRKVVNDARFEKYPRPSAFVSIHPLFHTSPFRFVPPLSPSFFAFLPPRDKDDFRKR